MVRSHNILEVKNMNMMEFLQIAQNTASRIGTVIDRFDINYFEKHNYTIARVWLNNGWIFDIVDDPYDIELYNGGKGDYMVKFRNEYYKLIDEMDEEEFGLFIYHKYMDRLEGEEDLKDDN